MKLNAEGWNARYLNENTPWDAGSATTPLREATSDLAKKTRILIPGAGLAHEAQHLHEQGFTDVYVCDWAAEALRSFHKRVPTFPEKHLICADFFSLEGEYDVILEQTFFCAIHPDLRSAYAGKVQALLVDGGKLLGVLFGEIRKEEGPPFGGTKTEYLGYFEPLFSEVNITDCSNSIKPRLGRELFIELTK